MRDGEHVGEDAELYALGTLGEVEHARVERHVRTCDECAARVGEAEAVVLALIQPQAANVAALSSRAPTFAGRTRWIGGAAAAIVVGFFAWGLTSLHDRSAHETEVAQTAAISAMLSGHFAHAAFVARVAGAPAAKVIYAREGGWIYVLAAPGTSALSIAVTRAARQQQVGTLPIASEVRARFISVPGRVDSVELLDRGVTIATARVVYPTH